MHKTSIASDVKLQLYQYGENLQHDKLNFLYNSWYGNSRFILLTIYLLYFFT